MRGAGGGFTALGAGARECEQVSMNDLSLKWVGWRPSLGVGTAHALRERGRRWTRD
jgi:hypothetical protein